MSNCEVVDLPPLELEYYQITEVLRCIVHTILFNRALGPVLPRDVDSELFDLTWVHCGDEGVDRRVEQKLSAIQAWAERHPTRRATVCLSFFERREVAGWFSKQERRLYWEQWRLPLEVLPSDSELQERNPLEADAARAQRKARLQSALEDCLAAIHSVTCLKRDHIPPVDSGAPLTYPFDVSLTPVEPEGSLLFRADAVRRMLSSTAPPSVLH
jgi:autophagy-related protein 101